MAFPIVAGALVLKFIAVSMINDAGCEVIVKKAKDLEKKFPNPLTKAVLFLLESNQETPVGIQLKQNVSRNHIINIIEKSDIDVKILSDKEISKLPHNDEFNYGDYDLIISGKPLETLQLPKLINGYYSSFDSLGQDQEMNTVWGRIYEKITQVKKEWKFPSLRS